MERRRSTQRYDWFSLPERKRERDTRSLLLVREYGNQRERDETIPEHLLERNLPKQSSLQQRALLRGESIITL